ncbi:LuxR C-terminal-related transcriptional regulator [Janthinobacterium sp. HLX7-2]|uniref:LuxR C-terminal-related transcriptional regulator n=1 Tax=Janthinobacterium sp. HLX7-2 TaxID=1259331 RepID=UPI003F23CA51
MTNFVDKTMTIEPLDPQLILQTSPPKTSWLLPRERLDLNRLGFDDKRAIIVQAPAGFGKTSLLMQWRRLCQAAGAVVVWLTVDERDNGLRLAQGVGNALYGASGGRASGPAFINWLRLSENGIDALTGLLVEIAAQAFNVVLILDNFERSREDASLDSLAYLIRNAPANLQIIIGARTGKVFELPEIIDQNIAARISSADLAFRHEETLAVIAKYFGNKLSTEASARLHALTEGWPLGLQLVVATLKKSTDLNAATQAISASAGDIQRYFVENLIARLAPDLSDFLTRLAVFDIVHPELCAAVFPDKDSEDLLARLQQDTPVFLRAENSCWIRMHGLSRDFLMARFEQLPVQERQMISARASAWLGDHAFYEEAARHALLAGNEDTAYELAERTLYQIGYHGRVDVVLKWIDRLPASELQRRSRLWMAAAWSLAISNRYKEAQRVVGYIMADPASDEGQCFEAALISDAAAAFDDQLDRLAQVREPWQTKPPPTPSNPTIMAFYANSQGFLNLYRFEPGKARHLWTQVAQGTTPGTIDFARGFAEFGIGFSYLWEGQFYLAEKILRAALVRYELEMGRRSPIACMIAAVLAATLWEMGGSHEPRAMLAYRIDVLERTGLPDAILLAYLTLARLEIHDGQEAQGFEHLNALIALGEARNMPRLQIAGLCEQIRVHAQQRRLETVAALCRRLESLCAGLGQSHSPFIGSWVKLHLSRAQGYRALAARDWSAALGWLEQAAGYADTMRLVRDSVDIRLLRGLAAERSMKAESAGLFEESLSLAKAGGMVQTLLCTHPEALDILKKISHNSDFRVEDLLQAVSSVVKPAKVARAASATQARAYTNTLLTAKEQEVLGLIAQNMSNKQIAIALDIGEETVKWHVKNVFSKLDAGTRAHAVKRAHILGILDNPNS